MDVWSIRINPELVDLCREPDIISEIGKIKIAMCGTFGNYDRRKIFEGSV
jgi:hypothetical protein